MGSRLRFRQSKFDVADNFRDHLNKLRPLLRRWLVPPPHPDMTDADYLVAIQQRMEEELLIEQG